MPEHFAAVARSCRVHLDIIDEGASSQVLVTGGLVEIVAWQHEDLQLYSSGHGDLAIADACGAMPLKERLNMLKPEAFGYLHALLRASEGQVHNWIHS